MSALLRKHVRALTLESGGEYAVAHAARLIRIVERIADGPYDGDAIWLAAHMHEWGTFPQWSRQDVDPAVRSGQLAEAELRKLKCPAGLMERVLEAIRYHHEANERSIEGILLRDADALDGLGAMGVVREFASTPTETAGCYAVPSGWGLRGAYGRAVMRMVNNPRMLRLPKSQELAREKTRDMQAILAAFERESFGTL